MADMPNPYAEAAKNRRAKSKITAAPPEEASAAPEQVAPKLAPAPEVVPTPTGAEAAHRSLGEALDAIERAISMRLIDNVGPSLVKAKGAHVILAKYLTPGGSKAQVVKADSASIGV